MYHPGPGNSSPCNNNDASSCRNPALNVWPMATPCHSNGEQSYYGRPSYHQPELENSSKLGFIYDQAYNSPQQTYPKYEARPTEVATSNGFTNGDHDDRALQNDVPPPLPTTAPPPLVSNEYQPMSRAMPAPMAQRAGRTQQANGNVLPLVRQTPQSPVTQTVTPSPTHVDYQMSRLGITDRHPPPAPAAAAPSWTSRSRDAPASVRARGGSVPSFARRQSAPGPCLPPSSGEHRKQWTISPCGFTTKRGQATTNGRQTPCEMVDGRYTPQSATPRTADGPKLFINGSPRHNQSFGSQESFLDNNPAVDSSSIRYNLREGEDIGDIGDYEQTSIRYTGKANPSKMFRLLQNVTGSDSESDAKMAQAAMRRQVRRRRPTQEECEEHQPAEQTNADDIVDISYVGANIPSRTFRCLQEAIGVRNNQGADESWSTADQQSSSQGRNVRVIHLRPSMKKHSSMDNILSCSDL